DILDALYFTVTTITTVGYGDHNFSQASNFMKSYGIFLMFFGTALLASIFSLITDFLLTEKLKNFFGSHLIPKKGHHILIGAGNIGSRVAEILIKNKIPTVIIESEKIGKFSEDIRRQLPLVEGNPKNRETLLQANIQGAKSIICVTDNDVDNLSITQKAKSMNPEVVTEVSIFDKAMALKLKSLLNPEAIISSPLISANFFVGSLFFEGVLFSVTLKKSLLLICDRDKWNERISLNKEQLLLRTELSLKGKKLIIIEIPTL
ncbi:MAG: NAD-binding protein, partial [Bdellovibrionales bacterium]|nr:NAD-binding protein [Bdellovibrionales bacterium]